LLQKQFLKRLLLYIFGLFLWAFGVAFAVNSELGISPINLVPFIASEITGIDMGVCVTVLLLIFMLLQIILLRTEYKVINLAQIIFATIFGYFVSAARFIMGDFQIPTYAGQLLMMAIGIMLISGGVTLYMEARVLNLPSEGLCEALVYRIPNSKFHRVKMVMDSTLVVIGIVLSLMFLSGLHGIREGTVISAILIGKLMPFFRKITAPVLRKAGIIQDSTVNLSEEVIACEETP